MARVPSPISFIPAECSHLGPTTLPTTTTDGSWHDSLRRSTSRSSRFTTRFRGAIPRTPFMLAPTARRNLQLRNRMPIHCARECPVHALTRLAPALQSVLSTQRQKRRDSDASVGCAATGFGLVDLNPSNRPTGPGFRPSCATHAVSACGDYSSRRATSRSPEASRPRTPLRRCSYLTTERS